MLAAKKQNLFFSTRRAGVILVLVLCVVVVAGVVWTSGGARHELYFANCAGDWENSAAAAGAPDFTQVTSPSLTSSTDPTLFSVSARWSGGEKSFVCQGLGVTEITAHTLRAASVHVVYNFLPRDTTSTLQAASLEEEAVVPAETLALPTETTPTETTTTENNTQVEPPAAIDVVPVENTTSTTVVTSTVSVEEVVPITDVPTTTPTTTSVAAPALFLVEYSFASTTWQPLGTVFADGKGAENFVLPIDNGTALGELQIRVSGLEEVSTTSVFLDSVWIETVSDPPENSEQPINDTSASLVVTSTEVISVPAATSTLFIKTDPPLHLGGAAPAKNRLEIELDETAPQRCTLLQRQLELSAGAGVGWLTVLLHNPDQQSGNLFVGSLPKGIGFAFANAADTIALMPTTQEVRLEVRVAEGVSPISFDIPLIYQITNTAGLSSSVVCTVNVVVR